MFKSNAKLIVMAFIIFVISLLFINNNYAKYVNVEKNNEITDWKVTITSDTKELKDTQKISFKVKDNPNVVNGKIAPGLKAIATVQIDLIGTKVPVDICAIIDDTTLNNTFKLTTKLDGENYTSGTTKTIELENNSVFTKENGNKIIILELEWINDDNNNKNDTILGIMGGEIEIPITINVKQNLKS